MSHHAADGRLASEIALLAPVLDEAPYGFATSTSLERVTFEGVFALVSEDRAWTVVARRADLETMGLVVPDQLFARISLGAETALDMVGLTALMATALAEVGIAANVIAGASHDHVFVPWERREQALALLERLELPHSTGS